MVWFDRAGQTDVLMSSKACGEELQTNVDRVY